MTQPHDCLRTSDSVTTKSFISKSKSVTWSYNWITVYMSAHNRSCDSNAYLDNKLQKTIRWKTMQASKFPNISCYIDTQIPVRNEKSSLQIELSCQDFLFPIAALLFFFFFFFLVCVWTPFSLMCDDDPPEDLRWVFMKTLVLMNLRKRLA